VNTGEDRPRCRRTRLPFWTRPRVRSVIDLVSLVDRTAGGLDVLRLQAPRRS